ncbi:MAG: hypothetical protein ACREEW_07315 [Caulobacteraceae bacterium]
MAENRIEDEIDEFDPEDEGLLDPEAQSSRNHTRRPIKTEASWGQGPKTRAANRERVKGSPRFNPR